MSKVMCRIGCNLCILTNRKDKQVMKGVFKSVAGGVINKLLLI